jgi:regulator of nonsense transcripts 1
MLIATALQCKVPRVLAVAHSNGAADVLLEALLELGLPAVRAGRANSFSASVQHRSVVALAEKMPQVTKFRRSHLHDGITAGQEWELQQLLQDTQRSILQSAPVVVTSCIGTRQIADLEETFFPLLVLDEAAQCTEPSLVCALMASRAEQLIMVGDTQQLPPTVPTASKDLLQSLGTSPMARLERLSVLQYTLRVQYRMPPSLMEHPSIYTYNGLVESANRTTDIPPSGFPWPSMSVPLSFVHVGNRKGETLHQGGGRSNLEEARLVARIVRNLLEANDVKASGIVVLTPYSNQVQTIKLELEKASLLARTSNGNGNLPRQVVVGTVDSYQGKECDVVIFSAVRSNELSELGFLRDRRRLNVAITRSKRGLILVGDTKVLESCRHWQALMKFCKDRSCFIDSSSSASDIFCDRSRTSRTKEHATISGLSDAEDVLGYKETKYYGLFDS